MNKHYTKINLCYTKYNITLQSNANITLSNPYIKLITKVMLDKIAMSKQRNSTFDNATFSLMNFNR